MSHIKVEFVFVQVFLKTDRYLHPKKNLKKVLQVKMITFQSNSIYDKRYQAYLAIWRINQVER